MTAAPVLVIDGRSSTLRRRLGPVAWSVLEAAVLSAPVPARPGGPVVVGVSARWVVEHVGVGKAAAARAIAVLVEAGVLVRLPGVRGRDGRYAGAGYLCRLPEGVSLSWPALPGGPSSGEPDTVDQLAVVKDGAGGARKPRAAGAVGVAGQASLFALDTATPAIEPDAAVDAQVVPGESCGAGLSDGRGLEDGGHELAPGVRVPARSGCNPNGGGG